MFKFVVLASVVACAFGAVLPPLPGGDGGRIVGGEEAQITDAPYQVALTYDSFGIGSFSLRCGGSIVSGNTIITAAHCVIGTTAGKWRIRAGSNAHSSGGQTVAVKSLKYHDKYSASTIDFDMASMILDGEINIDGKSTRAISLASANLVVEDNADAYATGWGSTFSGGSPVGILRKVTIPIVNQEVCKKAYAGFNAITDRMICAGRLEEGGKDACQGDSGGPLAVDGVLVGVTSWGRGCAAKGYPGVWSRVSSMREWFDLSVVDARLRQ